MHGVMADQRKALPDTTELIDTVYFVHPTYRDSNSQPLGQQGETVFHPTLKWIRQKKRAAPLPNT